MSFDHGQKEAQRSARAQLEFIVANIKHLRPIDKGLKMSMAADSMLGLCQRGTKLTPAQMSYADGIYELVMKQLGLPSVDRKIDVKRKGLRF